MVRGIGIASSLCLTSLATAAKVFLLGYGSTNSSLVQALRSAGHTVIESDREAEDYSGAPLPSGTQVVWLRRYYSEAIPAAGQTALRNFVNGGGGLILDGTDGSGWPDQWSTMADILPFTSVSDPGQDGGLYLKKIASDPVLNAGLPSNIPFPVYYSEDQLSFLKKGQATLFYNIVKGSNQTEYGGLIGWRAGLGKVLVCPFINYDKASESADCRRLWSNMINWTSRRRQPIVLVQNTANGALTSWNLTNNQVANTTTLFNTMSSSLSVVGMADFNADGQPDIGYRDLTMSTYRQVPLASKAVRGTVTPLAQRSSAYTLIGFGDVNRDGAPDAFYRGPSSTVEVDIMLGLYPLKSVVIGTRTDKVIGVGDFDGDDNADVLFQNTSTQALSYWKLDGTTVTTNVTYTMAISPGRTFVVGDVDGDGRAEVVTYLPSTRAVNLWYLNATTIKSNVSLGVAEPGYVPRGCGFWQD